MRLVYRVSAGVGWHTLSRPVRFIRPATQAVSSSCRLSDYSNQFYIHLCMPPKPW